MRACLVPASKNLLDLAVATHEVAPPSQTSASIPCFPHVAVARRIIATVARFSWIGTSILRTAIQLVKLDDILLRQTGSSPNDIFVVPVLWHHGYFAVAESTFVVMHYRPVVVRVSKGVDFTGLVEVIPHAFLDVVPEDAQVSIAIWPALLMVESQTVANFVDHCRLAPTTLRQRNGIPPSHSSNGRTAPLSLIEVQVITVATPPHKFQASVFPEVVKGRKDGSLGFCALLDVGTKLDSDSLGPKSCCDGAKSVIPVPRFYFLIWRQDYISLKVVSFFHFRHPGVTYCRQNQ